jgi:hypothetical protein
MNYKKTLSSAELSIKNKDYASCVMQCGTLMESALRDLLYLINKDGDLDEKNRIHEAERLIGKGKLSLSKMGLGQIIGVYRKADAWLIVRKYVKDNCSFIKKIDFDEFVELRNAAIHNKGEEFSYDKALEDCFYPVRRLLIQLDFIAEEKSAEITETVVEKQKNICLQKDCKSSLEESWNFCPSCGSATKISCISCKEELKPLMKICPYCETRVSEVTKKENQSNLDELRVFVRGALLDNYLSPAENRLLKVKRIELGVTEEEYINMKEEYLDDNVKRYIDLLETISIDHQVSKEERSFLDKKIVQFGLDQWLVDKLENTYLNIL